MVYRRHDNYKYAVVNEAMKVSRAVTQYQFNNDWLNDLSEIANNVDKCAVVNATMIVSNCYTMHNSMINWTNDTSEILNNVTKGDRWAMANEAIGLLRSMLS